VLYLRWALRGTNEKVNQLRQNKQSGPIPSSLLTEIPCPLFLRSDAIELVDAVVRVSPSSYVYPWHQDWASNILLQVIGTKTIFFCHPNFPCPSANDVLGEVEQFQSSIPSSQLRQMRKIFQVRLEPGDALCIPVNWWHMVKVVNPPSLSINYFYCHTKLVSL